MQNNTFYIKNKKLFSNYFDLLKTLTMMNDIWIYFIKYTYLFLVHWDFFYVFFVTLHCVVNIYYIVYVLFMYFNAAWVGWYNIIVNFIKTSCEINISLYYIIINVI